MSKKQKNKRKSQRAVRQNDNSSCIGDACLFTASDGCVELSIDGCTELPIDGCTNSDGCLDFNSYVMLVMLPLRWVVILGLMLYGDWDYKNHCAKTTNYQI